MAGCENYVSVFIVRSMSEIQWRRFRAFDEIALYLKDDVPEVRAAAVYALGQLMRNKSINNEHATNVCFPKPFLHGDP